MKSLVNDLLQVELSLCEEMKVAYPHIAGSFEKDKNFLARNAKTRGIGFFTLDLPDLESILLDGLESGRLVLNGPASRCRSKKIRVPRFLSGLWLRVFDKSGCLKPEVDTTAIFFLRQILCLGKKIVADCTQDRINNEIEEYVRVDKTLRGPSLNWESDTLDTDGICPSLHFCDGLDVYDPFLPGIEDTKSKYTGASALLLGRLQRICDAVAERFESFDPELYSEHRIRNDLGSGLRHGPGAVSDKVHGSDKYHFQNWPLKLQRLFPIELYVHGAKWDHSLNHELPSKLISVPKNAKKPRLIASEPTCYMYTQQLILAYMVDVVKDSPLKRFIDFKRQDLSHNLVRRGSLGDDLITVDLSSASDRLSCYVVERMFRKAPRFLSYLHATRTRYTSIRGGTDFLIKRKFASQGTAVTFPVQTIFFLCCVLASLPRGIDALKNNSQYLKGQVRVYGDDIIMPSTGYANLKSILTILDLKINEQKSFVNGHFRESCGFDAYNGDDVTPIKPMDFSCATPASIQSLIDFANSLHKKGCWKASDIVRSKIGRYLKYLPIIGIDSGLTGLISFCGPAFHSMKHRWNSDLQRNEIRSLTFYSKVPTKESSDTVALTRFFTLSNSNSRFNSTIEYASGRSKVRKGLRWVAADLEGFVYPSFRI
jgi:hypothetical protein